MLAWLPPAMVPRVSTAEERASTLRLITALQGDDHLGGGDDRVDPGGRIGAVAGAAVDGDLEIVGGGVALAVFEAEAADLEARVDVQAEDRLDPRRVQHAFLDQQLGAAHRFFGRAGKSA